MVVSRLLCVGADCQVLSAPPSGKPPLFIMLDGTDGSAEMFCKSPYLDALPNHFYRPLSRMAYRIM